MLFSNKYPNANEDRTYELNTYIWKKENDSCYICGRLTHFFETNMQCYICSEECDEVISEIWKENFDLNEILRIIRK